MTYYHSTRQRNSSAFHTGETQQVLNLTVLSHTHTHTHTHTESPAFLFSPETVVDRELPGSPRAQLRSLRTEELSTSFSTPGGAVERQTHKQASLRSD